MRLRGRVQPSHRSRASDRSKRQKHLRRRVTYLARAGKSSKCSRRWSTTKRKSVIARGETRWVNSTRRANFPRLPFLPRDDRALCRPMLRHHLSDCYIPELRKPSPKCGAVGNRQEEFGNNQAKNLSGENIGCGLQRFHMACTSTRIC